jgi:hypothetical protein
MSLHGTGAVCIWHDLVAGAKDDFHEWHAREHMPERVAIPGFRRGRRYVAVEGAPEYFNLYEADDVGVLGGPDYLARLNAPTAWTRRVVPAFRNVARSICRVPFSAGCGEGGVMLTRTFDVAEDAAAPVQEALATAILPPLAARVGVAGVHLCRADDAISNVSTAEKAARADATRVPAWIVLIEGISIDAVRPAGDALDAALRGDAALAAGIAHQRGLRAVYRLEHALDKR